MLKSVLSKYVDFGDEPAQKEAIKPPVITQVVEHIPISVDVSEVEVQGVFSILLEKVPSFAKYIESYSRLAMIPDIKMRSQAALATSGMNAQELATAANSVKDSAALLLASTITELETSSISAAQKYKADLTSAENALAVHVKQVEDLTAKVDEIRQNVQSISATQIANKNKLIATFEQVNQRLTQLS